MTANPTLLSMPLAQNGQKNVIPETQATAGDGLFSQSTGFPAETSLPLGAGGVAPSREDFNGIANLLGGVAFYAQKGWQFQFDAGQNYFAGCIVRDTTDGALYECINDVAAGGSVPSADSINWQPFDGGGGCGLYIRQNSTAYAVGDIAFNANLPSYMHLRCTTGGTTDSTEPDFTGAVIGGTISDGTVVWTYAAFADSGLSNLTSDGESHFITDDFTIIYPNSGTEANPATVTSNTRYVETNPFSGYRVKCVAEIQHNSQWGATGWCYSGGGSGVSANQLNDDSIIVQVGDSYLIRASNADGNPFGITGSAISTPLPCRVKVWKIGKVANS